MAGVFPGFVDTTGAAPRPEISIGVSGFGAQQFFSSSDVQFQAPAGLGDTVQFNDGGVNFGTGVSVNNWHPVNSTFVAKWSKRFPQRNSHRYDIIFVDRVSSGLYTHLKFDYETASLQQLNTYFATLEGRERYGQFTSYKPIMDDFALVGIQVTEIPEWRQTEMELTATTARRARVNAVTRSFAHKHQKNADQLLTKVWLVLVRRKLRVEDVVAGSIAKTDAGSEVLKQTQIAFPHYWQLHLIVQDLEPRPWMYLDSESEGTCMLIGTIIDVDEQNTHTPQEAKLMQQAISGVHNVFVDENSFGDKIEHSASVDIFLGS